ncbi:hypothetical protein [Streptacidiphilus neutrinimicus]|uniref:hypothetical protein n=1 Tax=Streptacidiphilus neutrinimicus TaxID=105420 RepID=UPI0006939B54|nr:hypothetical protein [Streptacidiphilus neutrinimicus]
MGWVYADGYNGSYDETKPHDGNVVAVLSDGTDAGRDTWEDGQESDRRDLLWAWSFKYDGREGRRKAQALRAICSCGWRGARRPADFTDPDACDPQMEQEWKRHCELSLYRDPTRRLHRLLAQLGDVFDELTNPSDPDEQPRPLLAAHMAKILQMDIETWQKNAVRAARDGGFSWDEIAGPLGMSKQTAHERFAVQVARDTDAPLV